MGDLFNNHEQIKDLLKSLMPNAREGLVDGLFESSVKLIYVSIISVITRYFYDIAMKRRCHAL